MFPFQSIYNHIMSNSPGTLPTGSIMRAITDCTCAALPLINTHSAGDKLLHVSQAGRSSGPSAARGALVIPGGYRSRDERAACNNAPAYRRQHYRHRRVLSRARHRYGPRPRPRHWPRPRAAASTAHRLLNPTTRSSTRQFPQPVHRDANFETGNADKHATLELKLLWAALP